MNDLIDYLFGAGSILTILFVVGVVLLIGAMMVGLNHSPITHGTYQGQTIDYSHQRGIIFKTNDLTTKTHERSSQREDWCVPDNDPQLVQKVREIDTGQEVKITYHRPLYVWIDTCQQGLKKIKSIERVNATDP